MPLGIGFLSGDRKAEKLTQFMWSLPPRMLSKESSQEKAGIKNSCFNGGKSGWEMFSWEHRAVCLAGSGTAQQFLHFIADVWFGMSLGSLASGVLSHHGTPLWEDRTHQSHSPNVKLLLCDPRRTLLFIYITEARTPHLLDRSLNCWAKGLPDG